MTNDMRISIGCLVMVLVLNLLIFHLALNVRQDVADVKQIVSEVKAELRGEVKSGSLVDCHDSSAATCLCVANFIPEGQLVLPKDKKDKQSTCNDICGAENCLMGAKP